MFCCIGGVVFTSTASATSAPAVWTSASSRSCSCVTARASPTQCCPPTTTCGAQRHLTLRTPSGVATHNFPLPLRRSATPTYSLPCSWSWPLYVCFHTSLSPNSTPRATAALPVILSYAVLARLSVNRQECDDVRLFTDFLADVVLQSQPAL